MHPILRTLTRPTVLLPVLLVAALLVVASRFGVLGALLLRMRALPALVMLAALACAAGYLVLKALQLRVLLANLGLSVPPTTLALAFSVGELTLTLPFGLFSQNWVMSASSRVRVGRSTAATVMMLLAEIVVLLAVLAILGLPGWPQLRAAATGLLAACLVLVLGMLRYEHVTLRLVRGVRPPALYRALATGIELLGCLKRLSKPSILALNVLLAGSYLGFLVLAFHIVGRGLGLTLDYAMATTIYAFALLVILIGGGALGQIGTIEALGTFAARAWGIGYGDGLMLMLGFRVVWTASMWLLNLPVIVLLWRFVPRDAGEGAGESAEQGEEALD